MATAVAVASRLVSDAHTSSAENTPSAIHRLQMAIADTECAQALLELAMSIVPAPPSPPFLEPSDTKSNSHLAPGSSKSLLKRELDSGSDGDFQQGPSDEECYRLDLVKRIKLDHNYSWTGDDRKTGEVILEPDQFRTYCETIKQNGSVPTSSENSQDCDAEASPALSVKQENTNESPRAAPEAYSSFTGTFSSMTHAEEARFQRQRTVSETKVVQVRTPRQRSSSESKVISASWKSKSEKKTSILKSKTGRLIEEEDDCHHQRHDSFNAETEDVSEGEEKFHKFQLLMKCLVANEPDDARALDSLGERHRTLSMSSDDTDEGPRSSPDSMRQNQGLHDYQCQVCQKTFLKKRYLTKHAFRMHPWLNSEEDASPTTTTKPTSEGACPHCKVAIKPKKDLQRHVTNCSENVKRTKKQTDLDLVGCQLCGVKMRRQLLVRHLAEEHCVDRLGDYQDRASPYAISVPRAEALGKVKIEEDGSAVDSLETSSFDRMDFDAASDKRSHTHSSWQHVSEFGATSKSDIHQHEYSATRVAACKSPM